MVGRDSKPTPIDLEPDMSTQRPDTNKPKTKGKPQSPAEKKSETTILSPEELRAISGGAIHPAPPPVTGPNGIVAGKPIVGG